MAGFIERMFEKPRRPRLWRPVESVHFRVVSSLVKNLLINRPGLKLNCTKVPGFLKLRPCYHIFKLVPGKTRKVMPAIVLVQSVLKIYG